MSKHKLENVELTNMCLIEDEKTGKVLVQIRNKGDWDGLCFPGGHIEQGESIVSSVIREIKEETGLTVTNIIPCGFKDWYYKDLNQRYIVIFFRTKSFKGDLKSESTEGENRWMSLSELVKSDNLASGFREMMDVFFSNQYSEMFLEEEKDGWSRKLL